MWPVNFFMLEFDKILTFYNKICGHFMIIKDKQTVLHINNTMFNTDKI